MSDTEEIGQAPEDHKLARRRRHRLAEVIERRSADIESRWLQRVQDDVANNPGTISPTELRDAMGDYLKEVAKAIRGGASIEAEGTSAWAAIAREHGLTRVRLGFDIDQLVREFILLRRIMVEVVREDHLIVDDRQGDRLTDLVEAAIATSVKSYVESRDLASRRAQAEHIGFITHELRNPLAAATMAADRLRRQKEVAEKNAKTLDMLDRAHARIRTLIDRVLLTERLEAQRMDCHPIETSLGQIMEEATRVARFDASQKGIAFSADYDPNVQMLADPGLTTSALQNVIDNAVKYTDYGRVSVTVRSEPTQVLIDVTDNCDGLSEQEVKTIFEPFKRAHSGKGGTGLGLAIARRAIEAQGGQVGVESAGERGCRFWLTLPRPPR